MLRAEDRVPAVAGRHHAEPEHGLPHPEQASQAAAQAYAHSTAQDGQRALETLAQRFGPIRILQTDGGSEFEKEFAEVAPQYAQEHGIARPYKKNDQAFIECFNGTLRREEFGRTPFKRRDLALAQRRADDYLAYYHDQRPHLALGMHTPAQFSAELHLR